MNNADVVIVGGGPAGLSSAIECGLLGLNVVLCEKRSFPIDKPCGEGILPHGVSNLERLGVLPLIDKAHSTPFFGVHFIDDEGLKAQGKFFQTSGLGIRRLALSKALYERALEIKNIQIFGSNPVLGFERLKDQILVRTQAGNFLTPLVVGADGLFSQVRKWAQLEKKAARFKRYGMRKHFLLKEGQNDVQVYFAKGIEAYVTPCGFGQTNVTFLWHKSIFNKAKNKITFDNLLIHFPGLVARLGEAKELSEVKSIGPLAHSSSGVIADGVALVGDASGYLDAITGEGNSLAFSQSRVLAVVIKNAVLINKNQIIMQKELIDYQKSHRLIVKAYLRNTRILLELSKRPRLMKFFIKLIHCFPKVFSYILTLPGHGQI